MGWKMWAEKRKNIWLGVSVEDQMTANERIPYLLRTKAAIRFISAEPLLSPIDIMDASLRETSNPIMDALNPRQTYHLDWVIVGGESGPGAR